jgi:hypothetical protein
VSHGHTAISTENGKSIDSDQPHQASHAEGQQSGDDKIVGQNGRSRGLSLETTGLLEVPGAEAEPLTGLTERTLFEDDSPVLGRPAAEPSTPGPPATIADSGEQQETPTLLTAATYQAPSKPATTPLQTVISQEPQSESVQTPTILDNVVQLRERSTSPASRDGTEFADDSPTAHEGSDESGDQWELGNAQGMDQGSIRIMLDSEPSVGQPEQRSRAVENFDYVSS